MNGHALLTTAMQEMLQQDGSLSLEVSIDNFTSLVCLNKLQAARKEDSSFHLRGACGGTSKMVKDFLDHYFQRHGADAECIGVHANHRDHYHVCVLARVKDEYLMVDPTIGQFIQGPVSTFGALGMFIGTRAELKDVVMGAVTKSQQLIVQDFPQFSGWSIEAIDGHLFRHPHQSYLVESSLRNGPAGVALYVPMNNLWSQGWGDVSALPAGETVRNGNSWGGHLAPPCKNKADKSPDFPFPFP